MRDPRGTWNAQVDRLSRRARGLSDEQALLAWRLWQEMLLKARLQWPVAARQSQ